MYTFSELLILCGGTAKREPLVVLVNLEARGAYWNVMCGTGKVWSKPNQAGQHITVRGFTTIAGNNTETLATVAGSHRR